MTETNTDNALKMEMSEEGLAAFLKYIYYLDLDDALKNGSVALELLKTGHKYDMAALEKATQQIFKGKGVDWFDVDVAMHLFLWSRKMDGDYEDVKMKAVQVIKKYVGMYWNDMFKKLVDYIQDMILLEWTFITEKQVK